MNNKKLEKEKMRNERRLESQRKKELRNQLIIKQEADTRAQKIRNAELRKQKFSTLKSDLKFTYNNLKIKTIKFLGKKQSRYDQFNK